MTSPIVKVMVWGDDTSFGMWISIFILQISIRISIHEYPFMENLTRISVPKMNTDIQKND